MTSSPESGTEATPEVQPPATDGEQKPRKRRAKHLTIGRCGDGWIVSLVSQLRRNLERDTIAAHGEIDETARRLIQSACRWEQASLIAQKMLRLAGDDLASERRLEIAWRVGLATEKRDRAAEGLRLDKKAEATADATWPWHTARTVEGG